MKIDNHRFSEQPFAKINQSSLTFKQLIENLRQKKISSPKNTFSENNPEHDYSNSSQACFSEAHKKISEQKISNQNNLLFKKGSHPVSAPEDNIIKLKVRGNVAGRDILNTKSNPVTSELKNVEDKKQIKKMDSTLNINISAQDIQKIEDSINTKSINNSNLINVLNVENTHEYHNKCRNENSQVLPIVKNPTFNQNKLNSKVLRSKKIKNIDDKLLTRYYKNANILSINSSTSEISDFFETLLKLTKVTLACPQLKKYKNCIYYGQTDENTKYEGFLYFYDNRFYYGQFLNGKKDGTGVQIRINPHQIVFKGIFQEGEKNGHFQVINISQREEYIGNLERGLYSGKGKLSNKEFIYEGDFFEGQKHGFGEEYHPRTGVKFSGYFNNGHFEKRSKSSLTNKQQQDNKFSFSHRHQRSKAAYKTQYKSNKSNVDIIPEGQKFERLTAFPFSSSSGFKDNRLLIDKQKRNRLIFNKQKIRSFMPPVKSHFHDSMPQNFQDFDYSFDIASGRNSEISKFRPKNVYTERRNLMNQESHKHQELVSYSPDIEQKKLNTSECQQPLPMPFCYPKNYID